MGAGEDPQGSSAASAAWPTEKKNAIWLILPVTDTLVSKIKPCMSKYSDYTVKLRTAHYNSNNYMTVSFTRITAVILELILALMGDFLGSLHFLVETNIFGDS